MATLGMAFNVGTELLCSDDGENKGGYQQSGRPEDVYWQPEQPVADDVDFFDLFINLDDAASVPSLDLTLHSPPFSIASIDPVLSRCKDDTNPTAPTSCSNSQAGDLLPLSDSVTQNLEKQRVLGAGTILNHSTSDAELAKLGELTMISPRMLFPPHSLGLPVSPRQGTAYPTSATAATRKPNKLGAFLSTVRNKAASTIRGRARVQDDVARLLHADMMEATWQRQRPLSPSSATRQKMPYTALHIPTESMMDFECGSIPLTPPLTAHMSEVSPQRGPFAGGYVDDPFVDLGMLPAADGMPHTPTSPSDMENPNGGQFRPSSLFPPLQSQHAPVWSNQQQPMWSGYHGPGVPNPYTLDSRNAPLKMAMNMQNGPHQALVTDQPAFAGAGLASSGLMIHMPQPRPPVASGLLLQPHGRALMPTQQYKLQEPATPSHQHHRHHRAVHSDRQRPKGPMPRAPSSGARHLSPRKRDSSRNGSVSPSPVPGSRRPRRAISLGDSNIGEDVVLTHSSSLSAADRSVSAGTAHHIPGLSPSVLVRKRRSFAGNGSALQRQAHCGNKNRSLRRATSQGGQLHTHSDAHFSPFSQQQNISMVQKQPASFGFVNFTPEDHSLLMSGVAPSGSLKTKARREKEAAERQRRLNAAVVKAVAAAGGDVAKLSELEREFGDLSAITGQRLEELER